MDQTKLLVVICRGIPKEFRYGFNKNSKNYSIAEQGAFPEYASLSRVQTLGIGSRILDKVDHQFSIYGRTSIPQAVKNHSAAVDINGEYIFSHGGITESGVTNQLLKYDIRSFNSWSILPQVLFLDRTIV